MFAESADRIEEKLKRRLRRAVLRVAEDIGTKLFGPEEFEEDERNISELHVRLD